MNKVGLIIIYNHNYESNIEKLERLYNGRFSNILHLMPFYQGNKENVVSVYHSSYMFHGYINQGYSKLSRMDCDQYLFVGDDALLNPNINETNIFDWFGVDNNSGGIMSMGPIMNGTVYGWCWALSSILNINLPSNRCQFHRFLPLPQEFRNKFKQCYGFGENLYVSNAFFTAIVRNLDKLSIGYNMYETSISKDIKEVFDLVDSPGELDSPLYPLVSGFSDVFIVPKAKLDLLCRYCGIFASINVFAEMAIPTIMAYINDNLIYNKWSGVCWGCPEMQNMKTKKDIEHLFELRPKDIFIHPIKLSCIEDI